MLQAEALNPGLGSNADTGLGPWNSHQGTLKAASRMEGEREREWTGRGDREEGHSGDNV